jgi:hypothetical protein
MKRLLFAMMVWLLSAITPSFLLCPVRAHPGPPHWIWYLCPDNGHPQFFAFHPRLLTRENELLKCLENAAVQASKFKTISVNAGAFSQKRSFLSKYLRTIDFEYDQDLARQLLSELVIVREFSNKNGTYIVANLLSETIDSSLCESVSNRDQEIWNDGTIEVDGYYTAVGVARRRRLLSDSIAAADSNAIYELSTQVSSVIDSGMSSDRWFGSESIDVQIDGLYILARSVSKDEKYFYSFAVCPKAQ